MAGLLILFSPLLLFFAVAPRSPQQVTGRLDELVREIREVISGNSASWPGGQIIAHRSQHAQDVVCVAHGHILAALAIRWVGLPLDTGMMRLIFEPGGVGLLGYVYHQSIPNEVDHLGWTPRMKPLVNWSATDFGCYQALNTITSISLPFYWEENPGGRIKSHSSKPGSHMHLAKLVYFYFCRR